MRDEVYELSERVATSSADQAKRIGILQSAVAQLSSATQNIAAQAEENAAAGQELTSQSGALMSLANRMHPLVGS